MKKKTMTPRQLAALALQRLKEKSDPVRAEGAQRYFKEDFQCFGLTAPQLRDLASEVYEMIKPAWGIAEAVEFCDFLLPNSNHEAKAMGILILERYRRQFPKSLFSKIRGWLGKNYLNNWAAVDVLCPSCVGALLERHPDLVAKIKLWAGSPNRWVRRASIVSFIKLAKKPGCRDAVYEIAGLHFDDNDDLIQKANGWLLREAGKADMIRLEEFLLNKGPAIPRTTLRYAIERFDKQKRRTLLQATKGSKSVRFL
jgi:3-methyladenine DNA glycosylase AlkD